LTKNEPTYAGDELGLREDLRVRVLIYLAGTRIAKDPLARLVPVDGLLGVGRAEEDGWECPALDRSHKDLVDPFLRAGPQGGQGQGRHDAQECGTDRR
jgi:hypothetical protein